MVIQGWKIHELQFLEGKGYDGYGILRQKPMWY